MATAFTRQLGYESGVQLNPLFDNSEIPSFGTPDQVFGIMMRATRGRIDKPFKVSRGTLRKNLGRGEKVSVTPLNEAYIHVAEAVNNGAYEAVVQRLITDQTVIRYAVAIQGSGATFTVTVTTGAVTAIAVVTGGTGYPDGELPVVITDDSTGINATATATVSGGIITGVVVDNGGTGYTTATALVLDTISYSVSDNEPTGSFIFSLKHLDCFNDGIKLSVRAEENTVNGVLTENSDIIVSVLDQYNVLLYKFRGSLNPDAVDDYGASSYLPTVVSRATETVILETGDVTAIQPNSVAYGYDEFEAARKSDSDILICFEEGGYAYSTQDYIDARSKLQYSKHNFAYLSSGGSESTAMLLQLATLAHDTNKQLRYDISGRLSIDTAISWNDSLNFGAHVASHLLHGFYFPVTSDDPTGVNGNIHIGVATLNIAYSCRRNAVKNPKGFARKNYAVAGRSWGISRANLRQVITPTDKEFNALARAKINPCVYETYSGGGLFVFRDSLTNALVNSSLRKLISVTDMSTDIDSKIATASKDYLQLPMKETIKRLNEYLTTLFENAEISGWLVKSDDPEMEGRAWKFIVQANEVSPYDTIDISYWLRFDGVSRQIFLTQTLTR